MRGRAARGCRLTPPPGSARMRATQDALETTGSVGHCLIERSLIPSLNAEDASPSLALDNDAAESPRGAGLATAARLAAPHRPVFLRALLLQPHPPHRLAESRGPDRAGGEHSLSLAIPRRPDRCPRRKPAVDRRGDRARDRRDRHHRKPRAHHRPGPPARPQARRKLRAVRRRLVGAGFLDQSGTHRAGAARPGLADQDARPHLRSRRRADPRQPQPVRPRRRHALRTGAALDRKARHCRANHDRDPHLAQPRRPAALS